MWFRPTGVAGGGEWALETLPILRLASKRAKHTLALGRLPEQCV